MDDTNPNFDIVDNYALNYFYTKNNIFTTFVYQKRWPLGVTRARHGGDTPWGSLTFQVNRLTRKVADPYKDASILKISSYTPRIITSSLTMSERKGNIVLFTQGRIDGPAPFTYYLNQEFDTCRQLIQILNSIFDPDSSQQTHSENPPEESRFTISDTLERIEYVMSHVLG
jgi:hypothetical protein